MGLPARNHVVITIYARMFPAMITMQGLTRMSVFRVQPLAKALRVQRWQMETVLRACPRGSAQM